MILGVPQGDRIPGGRPAGADFYTPGFPRSSFPSGIQPFATQRMLPSRRAQIPMGPAGMRPGTADGFIVPQQMPSAPGMNGFRGASAGFGHGPGADPYRTMRTGAIPGVYGDGRNLRYGVDSAGRMVRAQTPTAYNQSNDPAGSTAPIAPAAAPQAPAINGAWRGFGSAFGGGR